MTITNKKRIRKTSDVTALPTGTIVDSLDSNSTTDAPSIRVVKDINTRVNSLETNGMVSGDTIPVGGTMLYDGDTVPTGWEKVEEVYSNPNLLINGDFQVWQHGKEVTISNGQYLCDRWRLYHLNGTVSFKKVSNGLQVVSTTNPSENINIYQLLEYNPALENKEGVLSYSINGNVITVPWTIIKGGTDSSPHLIIKHITGLKVGDVVNWAKFELGSIATPFVPRLYAEELLMCQRFFQKSKSYHGSAEAYYGKLMTRIPLVTPMRTVASVTTSGTIMAIIDQMKSFDVTNIEVISCNDRYLTATLTLAEASVNAGEIYRLQNGSIYLDSEIY